MTTKLLRLVGVLLFGCIAFGAFGAGSVEAAPSSQSINETNILKGSGELSGTVSFCGTRSTDGTMLFLLNRSFAVRLGASGTFLFEYVPAGTYSLVIQIPGQAAVTQAVTVAGSANTNLGTIAICPDNDNDGFTMATDCNDNNPNVHPGATELCNGIDDNCNGTVDEGCSTCTDADADGYKAQASCGTLVDCNDTNATIHPGATELCNGVDDNCNGTTDEGFNLASDTQNCGHCGNVCTIFNASPACIGGQCQVGSCNQGFGNCDGNAANGCEVNFGSDAANCGACGHSCTSGVCNNGVCAP